MSIIKGSLVFMLKNTAGKIEKESLKSTIQNEFIFIIYTFYSITPSTQKFVSKNT